ncbi:hypothetical protein [uncultured Metabacillus sp.]|nr:hypothetical protein [uncultured Metabacillus sp.]
MCHDIMTMTSWVGIKASHHGGAPMDINTAMFMIALVTLVVLLVEKVKK